MTLQQALAAGLVPGVVDNGDGTFSFVVNAAGAPSAGDLAALDARVTNLEAGAYDEVIRKPGIADIATYVGTIPTDDPGKAVELDDGSIWSLVQGGNAATLGDWINIRKPTAQVVTLAQLAAKADLDAGNLGAGDVTAWQTKLGVGTGDFMANGSVPMTGDLQINTLSSGSGPGNGRIVFNGGYNGGGLNTTAYILSNNINGTDIFLNIGLPDSPTLTGRNTLTVNGRTGSNTATAALRTNAYSSYSTLTMVNAGVEANVGIFIGSGTVPTGGVAGDFFVGTGGLSGGAGNKNTHLTRNKITALTVASDAVSIRGDQVFAFGLPSMSTTARLALVPGARALTVWDTTLAKRMTWNPTAAAWQDEATSESAPVAPAPVVSIAGPYTITDADQGKILEVTGAQTLTIGTLSAAFQACKIIQIDVASSTLAGTFTGDYGATTTTATAGSEYTLVRTSGGAVYFHIGA